MGDFQCIGQVPAMKDWVTHCSMEQAAFSRVVLWFPQSSDCLGTPRNGTLEVMSLQSAP